MKSIPQLEEIIKNQATINIGTIGHVSHGKSTVVHAITGKRTTTHTDEMIRNITILLGYANAKIYQCYQCKPPKCYDCTSSKNMKTIQCKHCKGDMKLIRHVSFVDCPGHDILMSTMLNGASIMDAALLLIAANEPCPQPQTAEHLAAVEIMHLKNIIILQNKVDLIAKDKGRAIKQYNDIKSFVKGTIAQESPIIPISAQLRYNIDSVLDYIVNTIPIPIRNYDCNPVVTIVRSFDVNKPGTIIKKLIGGIIGGTVSKGIIRKGDKIEIRPGLIKRVKGGKYTCTPIITHILSLRSENNSLKYATPGGLIGIGTNMDPYLTRKDRLVGQVMGLYGKLPCIYNELEVNYYLLRKILGVKKDKNKVKRLSKNEILKITVGSMSSGGKVIDIKADIVKIVLTTPVCTDIGKKLAISRRINRNWRLIGWGTILRGIEMKNLNNN